MIEDPSRLTLQKSHDFYFSTNLTRQVSGRGMGINMDDVLILPVQGSTTTSGNIANI